MHLECPNCGVHGIVEHVAPEAVVEQVRCGNCGEVSAAPQTRWERLRNDFDGKQSPYPLKPLEHVVGDVVGQLCEPKPDPFPPGWFRDPAERQKRIKKMNTHTLLNLLRRTRSGPQERHTDTDQDWEEDSGWTCFITAGELKAELATRPHIPNKEERRAARRQAAKQKQERRRR